MQLAPPPAETIWSTSRAIREGRVRSTGVLEQCLARIEARENQVRAWVKIDRERAIEQAKALDRELANGHWRGPLHGIPIGIKDIIDVAGLPTAAGSRLWANRSAAADAALVARLRAAGAVILGKTVTTQYAWIDPPITRNPWNLEHTPGGSSSGSAAATACGMCLGALGSQTGGSITRPASYCGVAGLKPTHGHLSCEGVLPLSPSLDHPGPIARTVRDLGLLWEALAEPGQRPADWLAPLARPPRLGRLRGLFDERAEPAMCNALEQAIERLAAARAKVTEPQLPPAFPDGLARHRSIMASEVAAWHEERLRAHPDDYLPRITALIEEGLTTPAAQYVRSKDHQRNLKAEMPGALEGLDAFITPATTGPAPDPSTTGDPCFNSPWSYTGLPTISIPVSLSPEGLPLAIQLVGHAGGEENLFQTALWCEEALR